VIGVVGVTGDATTGDTVAAAAALFCAFLRAVASSLLLVKFVTAGVGNVFPIIFPREATPLFHTNGFL
jgi:hypothetical protein